jgi:Flp pilus assembly protein TadB
MTLNTKILFQWIHLYFFETICIEIWSKRQKRKRNGGIMWTGDPNIGVVMIIAIIFCSLAAVPVLISLMIFTNYKKRREAELIRLAIEKGMPVPDFTEKRSHYGTLKAGMIWIAVGLGMALMVLIESEGHIEGVSLGFIPILVGIALCISWVLESRESKRLQNI